MVGEREVLRRLRVIWRRVRGPEVGLELELEEREGRLV